MRHLAYSVSYSVVPINSLQLTITLYSSVITTPVYEIKYSVPFMTLQQIHISTKIDLTNERDFKKNFSFSIKIVYNHINCFRLTPALCSLSTCRTFAAVLTKVCDTFLRSRRTMNVCPLISQLFINFLTAKQYSV